jgi:thioredoxin 1
MTQQATSTGTVVAVTDLSFRDVVLSSPVPVLVDFWAEWCPPCHMIAPVLAEIAEELAGRLVVAKINVDENPGTAQRYGILAMPTLAVFREGEVSWQAVGARPKRRLLADLAALL